jgi:stringent starvation protein B
MVNPYLNRDESIILTTHNVSFNSLVTELILTNQRLIIFDTRHIQFRYQTIPLTTIETVMAREDTQGNPVMYLSVAAMTLDSAPQSKEFTFLPQTSGERRQECESWIQQLKEQIASIRRQKILATQPSQPEEPDIIFDDTKATIIEPVPAGETPPEINLEPPQSILSPPSPEKSDIIFDDTKATIIEPVPAGETPPEISQEPSESSLSNLPAFTFGNTESEAGLPDSSPVPITSDEQAPQGSGEAPQKEPLSTPSQPVSSAKPKVIALVGIIIVIFAIVGGAFIYSTMSGEIPVEPSVPLVTPAITTAVTIVPAHSVLQTPVPQITTVPTTQLPVMIPEKGIWVKVIYAGNFTGRVGTSGDLSQVNASGEQYYQLAITEGIVEATIQKQDGTGRELTVEVYQNGKMVARSTKATPLATVDLRLDLKKV